MAKSRHNSKLIRDYFAKASEPKLHLGSGGRCLVDWLNTDIEIGPNTVSLDATGHYPFEDNSFCYILCEHMIEHVDFKRGVSLLAESYRVLRPNGVIRVVTPNLETLLNLYSGAKDRDSQRYLEFFYSTHLSDNDQKTVVTVVNAMMRRWGHQFLYDQKTLLRALDQVGFKSVIVTRVGQSDHEALQKVENEERYPRGLLDFESLAIEGTK